MEERFQSACPQLYEGFCRSIPCADMTCPNGVLNLAGHCVANHVVPDLGHSLCFCHTTAQADDVVTRSQAVCSVCRTTRYRYH